MRVVIVEDEDVIRAGLSKLICKINNNVRVIATVNNVALNMGIQISF